MKMCLCCIKCLIQMWKTEDADTKVVWFAPWNVDLTHLCQHGFWNYLGWQKWIFKSVLCWNGFDLFVTVWIRVCIVPWVTPSEVNLVASYTYQPALTTLHVMYARALSQYIHTPSPVRAICAVRLQSWLFRHDSAFVVFYLTPHFMAGTETLSVPSVQR